jgi:hypothetical protein
MHFFFFFLPILKKLHTKVKNCYIIQLTLINCIKTEKTRGAVQNESTRTKKHGGIHFKGKRGRSADIHVYDRCGY